MLPNQQASDDPRLNFRGEYATAPKGFMESTDGGGMGEL